PPFVPELSGPDDTRYFEDEESEMKKQPKKPIVKTKDYAGQNLPFVGYTYIQSATPFVSWSKNRDQYSNTSNSNSNNSEFEILDMRLQEESKRVHEATNILETLKIQLERSNRQNKEFEAAARKAEADFIKLKSELRESQAGKEREEQEKMELENKLSKLKRIFDEEIKKFRTELPELQDTNARLEITISEFKAKLAKEHENAIAHLQSVNQMTAQKTELESQIFKLKKKEEERDKELIMLTIKSEGLSEKLLSETTKRAQLQIERSQISQSLHTQTTEFELLRKAVESEKINSEKLVSEYSSLHREKAIVEVDREALYKRLKDITQNYESEVEVLRGKLKTFNENKTGIQAAEADVTALGDQLQNLNIQKTKLSEEVAELHKNMAVKDLEIIEIKNKLKFEQVFLVELQKKCNDLEIKKSESAEQHTKLKCSFSDFQHEYEVLRNELIFVKESEKFKSENITSLQSQLEIIQQDKQKLSIEFENFKLNNIKSNENLMNSTQLIAILEQRLADERKIRMSVEASLKSEEYQNAELKDEISNIQNRLTIIKEQAKLRVHEEEFVKLSVDFESIKSELLDERQKRLISEKEHKELTSKYEDLQKSTQSITVSEKNIIIEDLKLEISRLVSRTENEEKRWRMTQEKLIETEASLERTRFDQNDEKKGLCSKSMDSLKNSNSDKGSITEKGSIKSKIRTVFFRNKVGEQPQIQLIQTQSPSPTIHGFMGSQRSMNKIYEDNTFDDSHNHWRRISNESSSYSLQSSQTKLSDMPGL
ncbi:CDC42 binding protein kinase, partial [Nowakowskiella sp. JEL0078]